MASSFDRLRMRILLKQLLFLMLSPVEA